MMTFIYGTNENYTRLFLHGAINALRATGGSLPVAVAQIVSTVMKFTVRISYVNSGSWLRTKGKYASVSYVHILATGREKRNDLLHIGCAID